MKLSRTGMISTITCCSLALGGCASLSSGYRPIVDGYEDEAYHADLADCQALAKTKDKDSAEISFLAGALVGGALGAAEDDSAEGALVGALLGGLIGGASGAADTHEERKYIVIRCMTGRGHPVVG